MKLVKVSDINKEHFTLIVKDQMTRDHLFQDSEITGWLLIKDDGPLPLCYELYRRGIVNGEDFDGLLYDLEDELDITTTLLAHMHNEATYSGVVSEFNEFFINTSL